jgi:hypothetical protein
MTKPVKTTRARMRMAAGTMACDKVRDAEAIVRKIILIERTTVKDIKRKKKKGPGSLLKFVIK